MWYSNLERKQLFLYVSSTNTDIIVPSLYQCVETRSIEVFWLLSQLLPHLYFIICIFRTSMRGFLNPVVNRFTRQTLANVNRKHFFMNILCTESFGLQLTHNRTLVFGSTLKHCRLFYYWNQPLYMRMGVCYLDCHEAGLCCYPVTQIEDLLRQIQLFYFHL
jgi:hypothetical protein